MALALKRKPLEVGVLFTLRHTVPFRPLCVMWSCKVGGGVSLCIHVTLTDNEG